MARLTKSNEIASEIQPVFDLDFTCSSVTVPVECDGKGLRHRLRKNFNDGEKLKERCEDLRTNQESKMTMARMAHAGRRRRSEGRDGRSADEKEGF